VQLPFWGDVSPFSRCEAAFSKRKPNWTRPSVHPPTIRHPVQSGSDYQGAGETLLGALGVVRLSGLLFAQLPKFFCGNLRIGLRKSYVCAPREEERFSRRSRFRTSALLPGAARSRSVYRCLVLRAAQRTRLARWTHCRLTWAKERQTPLGLALGFGLQGGVAPGGEQVDGEQHLAQP
jgi:hypothetical protein